MMKFIQPIRWLGILWFVLWLVACAGNPPTTIPDQTAPSILTATHAPKIAPTVTALPSLTVTVTVPPLTPTQTPLFELSSPPASTSGIPASFFGMTSVDANDYPAVTIGFVGHPSMFAWGWIERARGVYTWTAFDKFVHAARDHHVDIMLTFGETPGWAVANQSSCEDTYGRVLCKAAPDNLNDWKEFVTQIATRYKGQVKYYELWNEANSRTFWQGSIPQLVKMASVAYPIIKSIDPNALVLTPSVTGPVGNAIPNSASTWMTQYLQAGGSLYADGGTFHGYIARSGVRPYPMPEQDSTSGCIKPIDCFGSIITKVKTMRAVFDRNGLAGKPMFDTEGSWGNANIADPDAQSAWLARWYLLQAGLSEGANLQSVEWYTWGGGARQISRQTWGDIETNSDQPTQAGVAYDQVSQWVVGATLSTPCSVDTHSIWTCRLVRPGNYQALAIWKFSGTAEYSPASQFTQYRDLSGNTVVIPPGRSIAIGIKPLLLETANP